MTTIDNSPLPCDANDACGMRLPHDARWYARLNDTHTPICEDARQSLGRIEIDGEWKDGAYLEHTEEDKAAACKGCDCAKCSECIYYSADNCICDCEGCKEWRDTPARHVWR